MDAKEQLYYLLEHYVTGNYTTDVFTDEFSRIYDLEMDYSLLSSTEYKLMRELSAITGRFSPFEGDIKISNAYFNEEDIKKKAKEVFFKLKDTG